MSAVIFAVHSGCRGNPAQSALHPGGPDAERIAWLWWIMFAVFGLTFLLVVVLTIIAIFRSRSAQALEPPLGRSGFIVSGGIILPAVVLLPLYIYSLETSSALRVSDTSTRIRIVGRQWWWEIEYPDLGLVTANELYIPVGQPVLLELESADVIHSFWVPSLHGKRDMIPGITNEFTLRASRPGVYRGQCAEYCGTQHANMALFVVAVSPVEYAQWVTRQQGTPAPPATTAQQRGQTTFFEAGCARCHAVRGTAAQGTKGPDLTHIASRRSLGAGLLPVNHGNLAGWIGDAPALKPGVFMPATYLESDGLLDLVAYLESLR